VPGLSGLVVGAIFGWGWGAVLLVCSVLVLMFFRDPQRQSDGGPSAVLSPADGRVVAIDSLPAGHTLAPEAVQRISIFMSPLDVHVNRAPVDGVVEAVSYHRGQFAAAYKGHASEVNESNALLVRARGGYPLVVVQIAGWLARRIVCDVATGDKVARGERFGLIMFGSRVDLYLPKELSVKSKRGERVYAGRSVLAE
jgi:phosphatidylserine decarboxylase